MSKSSGPSLIQVPQLFSTVEPGVYRCASPTSSQVSAIACFELWTAVLSTHSLDPIPG